MSPYTFNQHVLPILQQRCAPCHADGGVAPTSLMRYAEARAQSGLLRLSVISGRMPPWFAESGRAAIKNDQQALTARELDILMTWAAGGTPEGTASPAPGLHARPASRAPDLIVAMPQPFTLGAQTSAADHEAVLASQQLKGKWIRAVELLPGTPSIVRRATVAIRTAGGEQVVGLWIPGDRAEMLEGNAAFYVPAEGSVIVRIHYQRPRPDQSAISDASRVAFFFARGSAARRVRTVDMTDDSQPFDRPVRAVGVRPVSGPVNSRAAFTLVAPDGSRTPLLKLELRPDWPRRYVFATPVSISRGSRIETTLTTTNELLWRSLAGDRPNIPMDGGKFRATLEIID